MPLIRKWLMIFARRRAEDFLRRQMGMPPRPGSRESRRNARAQDSRQQEQSSTRRRYWRRDTGPIIPREYAEDVEFVEYKDYSEETVVEGTESASHRNRRKTVDFKSESQVSDVEWVEVRSSSRNK